MPIMFSSVSMSRAKYPISPPMAVLGLGACQSGYLPGLGSGTRRRGYLQGRLAASRGNLVQCLFAVNDAESWHQRQRSRAISDVVDDMVGLIQLEKCTVQSLALVEEVHALDAVTDSLCGLIHDLPAKNFGVELLGTGEVSDRYFKPANLAEGFLECGLSIRPLRLNLERQGTWTRLSSIVDTGAVV